MRLRFGDCVLDSGTREVFRGEKLVRLSPKAFQLLELLATNRPNAISKDKIHETLWPGSFVVDGNLANLISEVREAVGDDARQPRVIRTVQRYGYAFQAEVETDPGPDSIEPGSTVYRLLWGEREIALVPGENPIGRERDSIVWIDDFDVSRHHARIVIDGAGARLEDLGSKNGTFVDEARVSGPVPLYDGAAFRVGSIPLRLRSVSTTASTQTTTLAP